MKRTAFEELVDEILETLPQRFAERLHNLVFMIEERAEDETLAEVGFDDPDELLGFFRGTPLTERTHDQLDQGPDLIILYQNAIEKETRRCGLPIRQVVRETLWHEIAHYFGFSEEEMDRIEDIWAGEGGRE